MKTHLYISTMAGNAWGGSEELWVRMAHNDLKKNNRVLCSVLDWGKLPAKIEKLKEEGAVIHKRNRFQFSEIHKKPWGKFIEKLFALRQLKQIVKRIKPDQVTISMGGFCDLEVDVYRRFLLHINTPFELIVHVNPENYYLQPTKIEEVVKVCQKAVKVWFVSSRLMEVANRQTGYSFPNGDIIKNPVNMPEIGILSWPNEDIMQLACVGRLMASVKGHPLLFQTLAQPEWRDRSWHLNIFGKGPDEEYYKLLVKSFGLEGHVSFKGFVNDIRCDIWKGNHILIMPSYYEGLPIALVEAQLCGRPAVVTNVGGNAEVLIDNVTGFISEGIHLASFRDAMNRAWEKKDEWKTMGEKGFTNVSKLFSSAI